MNAVTESKLRSKYIASLLDKMERICDLWKKSNNLSKRENGFEELFILIHNLYTSSMHGLSALAGSAKALKKTLNNHTVVKTDVVDCLG